MIAFCAKCWFLCLRVLFCNLFTCLRNIDFRAQREMDEDDDLSDNMEISIDEVLVDDDYSLSRSDQNSLVKSKLAEYLDPLCTALDGTDQNLIYKTFLNALCPVAFDAILPETDKLDIPLDMGLIKALEYEVLSVLLNTNDPLEAIAEFKKVLKLLDRQNSRF